MPHASAALRHPLTVRRAFRRPNSAVPTSNMGACPSDHASLPSGDPPVLAGAWAMNPSPRREARSKVSYARGKQEQFGRVPPASS